MGREESEGGRKGVGVGGVAGGGREQEWGRGGGGRKGEKGRQRMRKGAERRKRRGRKSEAQCGKKEDGLKDGVTKKIE